MRKNCWAVVGFVCLCAGVRAENWGQWRGPNFNGSTPETNLVDSFDVEDPDRKSTNKNLKWACELPGASNATPVIWGDHAFVTSTSYINAPKGAASAKLKNAPSGDELYAICIDVKTGKILWQKAATKTPNQNTSNTGKNTLASCSPVTDGKQVLFTFGTGEMFCYDMNGKDLWSRNIPKDHGYLTFMHGYSSTPLLWNGKLYVQMLRRDRLDKGQESKETKFDSYLLCLDWKSGKDVFKTPRISDAKDGEKEAYSSPVPYEHNGRKEILLAGALWISGHNPDDGKEYWHWGTLTPTITNNVRSVSLPVGTAETIIAGGPRSRPVFGVKSGGNGDLTSGGKLWEFKDHDCAVASPLVYDGFVYLLDAEKKKLTCMDPKSGQVKWSGSLDDPSDHAGFSASPVAADGKIYLLNERGNAVIVASQEFKVLCRVPIDEGFTAASPAIANGNVYFRTSKKLYCVGK